MVVWVLACCGCGSLLAVRNEYVYPPEGKFIQLGQYAVHYIDKGEGPAVVYVHGSMGTSYDFTGSAVYAEMVKESRIVAYDRPGSGYSVRPRFDKMNPVQHARVLHELILTLQLDRPVLICHSWGGAVCLAYALDYQEYLGGMVLLAPASYPWKGSDVSFYNVLPPVPVLGDIFMETAFVPAALIAESSSFAAVFAPDPVPQDYEDRAAAMAIRPSQFIASSQDMKTLRPTLRKISPQYSRINVPVTILHGEADSTVPIDVHGFPLHEAIVNSRLIVLKAGGHHPVYSRPAAVLDALKQCLRDAAAAPIPAAQIK